MNTAEGATGFKEVLGKTLAAAFFLLLLLELVCRATDPAVLRLLGLVTLPFFLVTLLSSYWGIWTFVATIPLVSGWLLLQGFGDPALAFTGVYLAWLPKKLVRGQTMRASTSAALCADLLAAIVLLNLCLFLARIVDGPLPSRAWVDWFVYFPFVSQGDNLWQINAALILLKGIFLFRMIGIEVRKPDLWMLLTRTVYVQGITIAAFSLVQYVNFKIRGIDFLGLYLPFNDVHSYGSYGVLLLVIFTCFMLAGFKGETAAGKVLSGGKRREGQLSSSSMPSAASSGFFHQWSVSAIVNGLFALTFFLVCIASSSRATWLAMGAGLLVLCLVKIRNRKMVVLFAVAAALAVLAGSLAADRMVQSGNPSSAMYRLGTLLNVRDIERDRSLLVRFELWNRAMAMAGEYPLTGGGIGNFYRNSVQYQERDLRKWNIENVHNYYLQLAEELGFPGLLLFGAVLFSVAFSAVQPRGIDGDVAARQVSVQPFLFGVAAYLVTMLTGHALLLSGQQLLFWSALAIVLTSRDVAPAAEDRAGTMMLNRIGILVFILYLAGFGLNVSRKGPWTIPAQYGLYPAENWDGEYMRWMAGKAQYFLPEGSRELDLKVVAQPFNSQGPEGLTLTVALNGSVVDRVRFTDGGEKNVRYKLTPAEKGDIRVNLEVDRVFSPRKIGLSRDIRTLGVALGSGG